MKVFKNGKNIVEKLFELNSFAGFSDNPLITVLRNTKLESDESLSFIQDAGENNCDMVLLITDNTCVALEGRSFPHKDYQKKQVDRTANACYIATGWYPGAWEKGYHREFPALIQRIKFLIWRSTDMILGDDDDYNQYDIVSDNFHGFAPWSAGCVTVKGQMYSRGGGTDDWSIAYNWIYGRMNKIFSAAIFNFKDLDDMTQGIQKLRFGSSGERVKDMQKLLQKYNASIEPDGDFGPQTHTIVMKFQAEKELVDDGICGPKTLAALQE